MGELACLFTNSRGIREKVNSRFPERILRWNTVQLTHRENIFLSPELPSEVLVKIAEELNPTLSTDEEYDLIFTGPRTIGKPLMAYRNGESVRYSRPEHPSRKVAPPDTRTYRLENHI